MDAPKYADGKHGEVNLEKCWMTFANMVRNRTLEEAVRVVYEQHPGTAGEVFDTILDLKAGP